MKLQRWLNPLLIASLLLCCVTVVYSLFHSAGTAAQISDAQARLEAVQGRLRKQQQEYAQALENLPLVEAEAARVIPEAEAAYEQEQALRQQRRELRTQNAALAEELALLQAEAEAAGQEAQRVQEAVLLLQEALNQLALIAP